MWKFIKSATDETNWLKGHAKEICFIGRSNVGKSSLINALANQKVARTSNTPGRTQLINFFDDNGKIYVDLPGYGWAKMSKQRQNNMLDMIENYIENKQELVRVFVLIDSKVGPTKDDLLIINFLKEVNKNFMIVLTKGDKPNQSELHKTTKMVQEIHDDFIIVSSAKGRNISKLGKIIGSSF